MIGLHGTSLWSARRLLREGWSPRIAGALATPRMRTPPDHIYAVWLDKYEPAHALWVAQQWAIEAAERATPVAGRRLRGAVLAVEADDDAMVTPYAERIVPASSTRLLGVVCVGAQPTHACPVCDAVGVTTCDVAWRWRVLSASRSR